jgi:uncharacterized protein (TIGR02466 family)
MKARFHAVNNTLLAFATPIRQRQYADLDDFNAELAQRILALREREPGERRSNAGGWHSGNTLLQTLGEPLGTRLGRMFLENVNAAFDLVAERTGPPPAKASIEAWANVNTRGDSNVAHIHPGSAWSGVYYVAASSAPDAGGELVLSDPRTAALMHPHPFNPFLSTNGVTVTPKPGLLVVFPSFVYHSVNVYHGEQPRITVAFNLL